MCDLKPEGCVARDIAPLLDARRSSDDPQQWHARCPSHPDQKRSLSVRIGTDGQRLVWKCWAGCDPKNVRKSILAKGIGRSCLGSWSGESRTDRSPDRKTDEELRAWLEELVKESASGNALRLQIALRLWPDVDDRDVATKLGMSQATYYRYRPK